MTREHEHSEDPHIRADGGKVRFYRTLYGREDVAMSPAEARMFAESLLAIARAAEQQQKKGE